LVVTIDYRLASLKAGTRSSVILAFILRIFWKESRRFYFFCFFVCFIFILGCRTVSAILHSFIFGDFLAGVTSGFLIASFSIHFSSFSRARSSAPELLQNCSMKFFNRNFRYSSYGIAAEYRKIRPSLVTLR